MKKLTFAAGSPQHASIRHGPATSPGRAPIPRGGRSQVHARRGQARTGNPAARCQATDATRTPSGRGRARVRQVGVRKGTGDRDAALLVEKWREGPNGWDEVLGRIGPQGGRLCERLLILIFICN